ncbi:MAG TPA: folylpolyglutamate synthase/dihydrofolate synthase family protein [Candidatus Polarisedimenticolaceae bacterium]|nr:folylpolyglutamate synthase/dihydrofolate synthase family protein [Candidatus Polarisedimenticolaceae bacterium]
MPQDPVAWLYALQSHGIKLGLDGIRGLLAVLGHPERAYPIALVGGTNGKGSTAAMLDAMLAAHGVRSGLYTSPHLVRPNERVRVAGADIPDADLGRALDAVRRACEQGLVAGSLKAHPSFFEVMTAVALHVFRETGVRAAILEVGLGGRLDATNATDPAVAAIVTVDLDHTATLGSSFAAIAREKVGIARAGRPLVSGVSMPEAVQVLRERCRELGAPFVDARTAHLPSGVRLALDGAHQRDNARVAVATLEAFAPAIGVAVDPSAVRRGLETVRWPGRLQWLPGAPAILLDGAHNAAGTASLAAHLGYRGGPKPVLLFGAMADKDLAGMIAPLAPHVAALVATRPAVTRAAESREIADLARAAGVPSWEEPVPERALERARGLAGPGGVVLVAGSLYLIGEILGVLETGNVPGPVPM